MYVQHALNWPPPGLICTAYLFTQSLQRSLFTPASWRGHLQIISPHSPAKGRCRLLSVHSGDRKCASSTALRKNKLEIGEIEAPASHAKARNIKKAARYSYFEHFRKLLELPTLKGWSCARRNGQMVYLEGMKLHFRKAHAACAQGQLCGAIAHRAKPKLTS